MWCCFKERKKKDAKIFQFLLKKTKTKLCTINLCQTLLEPVNHPLSQLSFIIFLLEYVSHFWGGVFNSLWNMPASQGRNCENYKSFSAPICQNWILLPLHNFTLSCHCSCMANLSFKWIILFHMFRISYCFICSFFFFFKTLVSWTLKFWKDFAVHFGYCCYFNEVTRLLSQNLIVKI